MPMTAMLESVEDVLESQIRTWLDTFARCVRERDFDSAFSLFSEDIFAYGTRADEARGIDQLRRNQWEYIWPATTGFTYDFNSLQFGGSDSTAWCAARWSSTGYSTCNEPFTRKGRVTFIFQRVGDRLVAEHCHHSLCPSTSGPSR